MKDAKPFTRKQSIYMITLQIMLQMGHTINDSIRGAKQAANEFTKL